MGGRPTRYSALTGSGQRNDHTPRSVRAAAARSEPLAGLLDAGNGRAGGYRAALNAGARSGSGVSGRGRPGTFASTCCTRGRT